MPVRKKKKIERLVNGDQTVCCLGKGHATSSGAEIKDVRVSLKKMYFSELLLLLRLL